MTSVARQKAASALRAAFFICVAGLSQPGWALFSDDEARRAILDLRARVEVLANRIGDLERQLQTSSKSQLDMLNENERLRSEVSRLRGELEETSRATSTGKKQQSEQREKIGVLEQRLRQIEPVTIDVDGVRHSVSPVEASQFEKLQETLRSGDFKTAAASAASFETAHPGSSLAANALFMRGTALYALKDYKPSIAARLEFLKRYPTHPFAPQAMLNLAASQAETGNPNTSRATLESLVKTYPNSAAAAEARERLKTPPKAPAKAPSPPPKSPPPPAAKSAPSK